MGHFIEKYYSPEDAKEVNVNKKLEHLVRNVVTKDPTIKNETVTRLVITLFELRVRDMTLLKLLTHVLAVIKTC